MAQEAALTRSSSEQRMRSTNTDGAITQSRTVRADYPVLENPAGLGCEADFACASSALSWYTVCSRGMRWDANGRTPTGSTPMRTPVVHAGRVAESSRQNIWNNLP